MGSARFLWKLYAGALGMAMTLLTHKLLKTAWKLVTGSEPPQPADPKTPAGPAITWALASGLGLGVTQLLTRRFIARRWTTQTGQPAPDPGKIKLIL